MRISVVSVGLAALVMSAAPLRGQGLFTDARRAGMGGVSLRRDGTLERYNPAYRSVPKRSRAGGGPKFTLPLPIGLLQWAHDHPGWSKDPMFHPDSARFNPIEIRENQPARPGTIVLEKIVDRSLEMAIAEEDHSFGDLSFE